MWKSDGREASVDAGEPGMDVGNSVRKAIDEWEGADHDSAMLHACNAVDGTAAKVYPKLGSNARFTGLLRDNYHVLGPMGVPGIDLERTRFPVKVENPKAGGAWPDLADVVYGIHRCCHAHGKALPGGFDLVPDASGPPGRTVMEVRNGIVRLSDRIIFGLLAVAVLSPANVGQQVPDGYHLTYVTTRLPINEWWGRAADFPGIVATHPLPPLVRLDFGDWMVESPGKG